MLHHSGFACLFSILDCVEACCAFRISPRCRVGYFCLLVVCDEAELNLGLLVVWHEAVVDT